MWKPLFTHLAAVAVGVGTGYWVFNSPSPVLLEQGAVSPLTLLPPPEVPRTLRIAVPSPRPALAASPADAPSPDDAGLALQLAPFEARIAELEAQLQQARASLPPDAPPAMTAPLGLAPKFQSPDQLRCAGIRSVQRRLPQRVRVPSARTCRRRLSVLRSRRLSEGWRSTRR